jgi:hypothetical protein
MYRARQQGGVDETASCRRPDFLGALPVAYAATVRWQQLLDGALRVTVHRSRQACGAVEGVVGEA